MGEDAGDTFHAADLTFLREAATQRMPGYRPLARDSGHVAWIVLEPEMSAVLPRFTICRIDPCIIVQIEDAGERRFVSVASLEDAIVIAQRAVCESQAHRATHAAPAMLH